MKKKKKNIYGRLQKAIIKKEKRIRIKVVKEKIKRLRIRQRVNILD